MPGLYTHTTRASGLVLTASIYNADHVNHITNQTPQMTDDYSENTAQMQVTTDPYPGASASLATSLSGEIERLRFLIKQITGRTDWYIDPPTSMDWLVTNILPVGTVLPYAGASAPYPYLICDGSAISRTTYATLFAIVGTSFGSGDGSTTFNLPNLKGRVPVGIDTAQGEFVYRGITGGSKTHQLSVAELATHNHGVTDPTHTHNIAPSGGIVVAVVSGNYAVTTGTNVYNAGALSAASTGISIQTSGSNQAHNNLQPYLGLYYIIKYI